MPAHPPALWPRLGHSCPYYQYFADSNSDREPGKHVSRVVEAVCHVAQTFSWYFLTPPTEAAGAAVRATIRDAVMDGRTVVERTRRDATPRVLESMMVGVRVVPIGFGRPTTDSTSFGTLSLMDFEGRQVGRWITVELH